MNHQMLSGATALKGIRKVAMLGIAAVLFAPAGVAGDCTTDKAFAEAPVLAGKTCGRIGEKARVLSDSDGGTKNTVSGACGGAPYDC